MHMKRTQAHWAVRLAFTEQKTVRRLAANDLLNQSSLPIAECAQCGLR